MTTQTRRYRRWPNYPSEAQWSAWYARHMCACGHISYIHNDKGKGACSGEQESGPCPCQAWFSK